MVDIKKERIEYDRQWLDCGLHMELMEKRLKVRIGGVQWEISFVPGNIYIARNDRYVAFLHEGFEQPFISAIEELHGEIRNTVENFRSALDHVLAENLPKKEEKKQ
jgi:hypothetical protein